MCEPSARQGSVFPACAVTALPELERKCGHGLSCEGARSKKPEDKTGSHSELFVPTQQNMLLSVTIKIIHAALLIS